MDNVFEQLEQARVSAECNMLDKNCVLDHLLTHDLMEAYNAITNTGQYGSLLRQFGEWLQDKEENQNG